MKKRVIQVTLVKPNIMIVVTGSDGFIGRNLVSKLKKLNYKVVEIDPNKGIHPADFSTWWIQNYWRVSFVFHLGANTDTLETDKKILDSMNTNFSKIVWYSCYVDKVPLIYASSAATYGDGTLGYSDDHKTIPFLVPLNAYGQSKQDFDEFAVKQRHCPPSWYGLKFFNVYGCPEQRKGRMASMVYHGYEQLKDVGHIKLFRNGEHRRDFIYVDDVVKVMIWLFENRPKSGIYNVGTGHARSFNELAKAISIAMDKPLVIKYIDMPPDLVNQYQSFTQADITKLRDAGYTGHFQPIEQGVLNCIKEYENYNQPLESEVKKW